MLNKFYVWVGKNSMMVLLSLLFLSSLIAIINLVDVVRKPPSINVIEGSIQHHLVWSNKGECFFVRPHSSETVYLIRVQDCDKGK
jgi:hypothetical protein